MRQLRPSLWPTSEQASAKLDGRDASLEAWLLSDAEHRLSPFAYHLGKVEWGVFGTLTFGSSWLTSQSLRAKAVREKLFNDLLKETCKRCGSRYRNLAVYRKTEYGGAMQAHHVFLIAAKGLYPSTPEQFATTSQTVWSSGQMLAGSGKRLWQAVIEPFDKARHWNAVTYQAKMERDASGKWIELEEYCSGKLKRLFHEANAKESSEPGFAC